MPLRPSSILRAALAAGAGLLLTLPAFPAAADELPAPGTGPFVATDDGEDGCTVFFTGGLIVWPQADPEPTTVSVDGWRSIANTNEPTDPCLPIINSDRHIEFTAYGDGEPIAEHFEPFLFSDNQNPAPYEFDLSADAAIESVTVAVCLERRADGSTWPDRCGPVETVTPAEDSGPGPEPHCRYDLTAEQWWGGGFLAEIEILPLAADAAEWRIEFTLPEGTVITALWNGEWTQTGSTVTVTNAAWNGSIHTGDSVRIGFTGSGELPSAASVFVNGEQCWDVNVTA